MSRTFERLLEHAGLDEADLPATLEECEDWLASISAEIETIKDQLECEARGITSRGKEWAGAAQGAMNHRRSEWAVIQRVARNLRGDTQSAIEAAIQREREKARNREASLQRAIDARDAKVQRAQFSGQRQNHALVALKSWVRDNFPDRADEAFAVVSLAQSEYDAIEKAAE